MAFIEKVFRQQLINNVAGEAWDPAETIRTVLLIKSALISSESELYNVLKYIFAANELHVLNCGGGYTQINIKNIAQLITGITS